MRGLIDSTLREGGQQVGVAFTWAAKMAILQGVAKLGIEEMELGVVGGDRRELASLLAAARQLGEGGRLSLWCRCRPADIEEAVGLRPDVLSLSIPSSDLHLQRKFGRPRRWALSVMSAAITQARAGGIGYVSVGFEDASRAEHGFLLELASAAVAAGAKRVRLADTVGVATPELMASLVRMIRQIPRVEIGVHTHNDFGMATANAVAALGAGADWADVTVLGLGERAGNARLEEVVGYLVLAAKEERYRLSELNGLCRLVAEVARHPIGAHHPVVGAEIFRCESGLHVQGLLKEPATYEPFPPERVGMERRLLFGGKSGRRAVADFLTSVGLELAGSRLDRVVAAMRQLAVRGGRPLTGAELATLARTP